MDSPEYIVVSAQLTPEELFNLGKALVKDNNLRSPALGDRYTINSLGMLHSFDDQPAYIRVDGTSHWFNNGSLHRECGPASIWRTKDKPNSLTWAIEGIHHSPYKGLLNMLERGRSIDEYMFSSDETTRLAATHLVRVITKITEKVE